MHLKHFLRKSQHKEILDLNGFLIAKTKFKKDEKINFLNNILLTTSGTTQNPKMVRLSGNNLYVNTKCIIDYLKLNLTTQLLQPCQWHILTASQ